LHSSRRILPDLLVVRIPIFQATTLAPLTLL
jgi:hypothetical protein